MDVIFNVLLVILVIAVVVLAVLYFLGRKMEKRQVEQQSMMEAAKQVVSILVIDKKKLSESGCSGVFFPAPQHIHIVFGPLVEFVRNAVDDRLEIR